jgi:hypothetical protein
MFFDITPIFLMGYAKMCLFAGVPPTPLLTIPWCMIKCGVHLRRIGLLYSPDWSPVFTGLISYIHQIGLPYSPDWSPIFTELVSYIHRTGLLY